MSNDPYQATVEQYRQRGYDRVHIHDESPNFRFHRHFHPHDVTIHVLRGDLEVTVDSDTTTLTAGESLEIPVGRLHAKCIGPAGCVYIHAEKHYHPKKNEL